MNVGVAPNLFHIVIFHVRESRRAAPRFCFGPTARVPDRHYPKQAKLARRLCGKGEKENRFSWLDACQKHVGAGLFETRPYVTQDDLMLLLRLSHSVVFRAG